MTKKYLGFILAGGMLVSGCLITGTASVRSQNQTGGILVLVGDENKAMADANNKMGVHCGPGNFTIVARDTVKVGSENYANSNTGYDERTDSARDTDSIAAGASRNGSNGSDYVAAESTREDQSSVTQGGSSTSSVSGTRDVNEIRITYRCGGAAVAPAPAPVPPPAPAPPPPPPLTCQSAITCATAPPICPVGATPVIENGCFNGGCMAKTACPDGAPFACSDLNTNESACSDNTACRAVSQGVNCTAPDGSLCKSGASSCSCASFIFGSCEPV